MSVPTLPKGKVAILVMDCQNDIVHEQGKFGGASLGVRCRGRLKREIFSAISRSLWWLGERPRFLSSMCAIPIGLIMQTCPAMCGVFQAIKKAQALQDGTWGAEIHADLTPDPSDWVITKTRVSSFYASPLEGILQAQGITHLVLTGIATDGVVEGTARDGADRGYSILIPDDCCAATTEEAHRVILGGILSALTTVCKADEVIQALPRN